MAPEQLLEAGYPMVFPSLVHPTILALVDGLDDHTLARVREDLEPVVDRMPATNCRKDHAAADLMAYIVIEQGSR